MQHTTRRGLLATTAGLAAAGGPSGSRTSASSSSRAGARPNSSEASSCTSAPDFSGPYRDWSGPATLTCVH